MPKKTKPVQLAPTNYQVTVKTSEGYFDLSYTARTVAEVKAWAATLDGVTEVCHVTILPSIPPAPVVWTEEEELASYAAIWGK